MHSEAEVTIVGGGLDFSMHPSVEACRAIRHAKVVFHAGCHEGVARWLADLAGDADVVDIDTGHYQVGQYRPDMYRAMASRVVGAARESGAVVLIEPGSAMVTDLVTRFVLEAAHGAGLRTRIVAGISSLEHLCIAFGIDPSSGLQTVLAQELVARRIRLSAGLDTVVIQPGYFDTLWHVGWPQSRADRFDALAETLSLSFGPRQAMALVRFPMHPGDVTHEFWFELADLHRTVPVMTPLHTLFVPASERGERDAAFQSRMHVWERSIAFLETGTDGLPQQLAPIASNGDLKQIEARLDDDLVSSSRTLADAWRRQALARSTARIAFARKAGTDEADPGDAAADRPATAQHGAGAQ